MVNRWEQNLEIRGIVDTLSFYAAHPCLYKYQILSDQTVEKAIDAAISVTLRGRIDPLLVQKSVDFWNERHVSKKDVNFDAYHRAYEEKTSERSLDEVDNHLLNYCEIPWYLRYFVEPSYRIEALNAIAGLTDEQLQQINPEALKKMLERFPTTYSDVRKRLAKASSPKIPTDTTGDLIKISVELFKKLPLSFADKITFLIDHPIMLENQSIRAYLTDDDISKGDLFDLVKRLLNKFPFEVARDQIDVLLSVREALTDQTPREILYRLLDTPLDSDLRPKITLLLGNSPVDQLQCFHQELDKWVNDSPEGEKANRINLANRFKECPPIINRQEGEGYWITNNTLFPKDITLSELPNIFDLPIVQKGCTCLGIYLTNYGLKKLPGGIFRIHRERLILSHNKLEYISPFAVERQHAINHDWSSNCLTDQCLNEFATLCKTYLKIEPPYGRFFFQHPKSTELRALLKFVNPEHLTLEESRKAINILLTFLHVDDAEFKRRIESFLNSPSAHTLNVGQVVYFPFIFQFKEFRRATDIIVHHRPDRAPLHREYLDNLKHLTNIRRVFTPDPLNDDELAALQYAFPQATFIVNPGGDEEGELHEEII